MSPDPYRTLELSRDATDEQIREAYFRLARLHHPDHNQNDPEAIARFKEIQQAFEKLSKRDAEVHEHEVHTREWQPVAPRGRSFRKVAVAGTVVLAVAVIIAAVWNRERLLASKSTPALPPRPPGNFGSEANSADSVEPAPLPDASPAESATAEATSAGEDAPLVKGDGVKGDEAAASADADPRRQPARNEPAARVRQQNTAELERLQAAELLFVEDEVAIPPMPDLPSSDELLRQLQSMQTQIDSGSSAYLMPEAIEAVHADVDRYTVDLPPAAETQARQADEILSMDGARAISLPDLAEDLPTHELTAPVPMVSEEPAVLDAPLAPEIDTTTAAQLIPSGLLPNAQSANSWETSPLEKWQSIKRNPIDALQYPLSPAVAGLAPLALPAQPVGIGLNEARFGARSLGGGSYPEPPNTGTTWAGFGPGWRERFRSSTPSSATWLVPVGASPTGAPHALELPGIAPSGIMQTPLPVFLPADYGKVPPTAGIPQPYSELLPDGLITPGVMPPSAAPLQSDFIEADLDFELP